MSVNVKTDDDYRLIVWLVAALLAGLVASGEQSSEQSMFCRMIRLRRQAFDRTRLHILGPPRDAASAGTSP
jgi:hypothetical protein